VWWQGKEFEKKRPGYSWGGESKGGSLGRGTNETNEKPTPYFGEKQKGDDGTACGLGCVGGGAAGRGGGWWGGCGEDQCTKGATKGLGENKMEALLGKRKISQNQKTNEAGDRFVASRGGRMWRHMEGEVAVENVPKRVERKKMVKLPKTGKIF